MFYLETIQFNYNLVNDDIISLSKDKLEFTVSSEALKNVCTKPCIFDPFIKIFNSTSYFPSYFSSVELKVNVK
jgi:hypothetical protein